MSILYGPYWYASSSWNQYKIPESFYFQQIPFITNKSNDKFKDVTYEYLDIVHCKSIKTFNQSNFPKFSVKDT